MAMTLTHENGNIYRATVSGMLKKAELDRAQDQLDRGIADQGPVRLLIELTGFQGWEPGANWSDLTFYVARGDAIERIAIVGDERWRSEALMFAAADLRKGPVEFFTTSALVQARRWLAA